MKKRRFGKNPTVDTSFLPDRDREVCVREREREEWLCSEVLVHVYDEVLMAVSNVRPCAGSRTHGEREAASGMGGEARQD